MLHGAIGPRGVGASLNRGATSFKGKGAAGQPPLAKSSNRELDGLNVLSLKPLRSLYDAELHGLAFLQAAEAGSLDSREMHEYIFAALPGDKAKTLSIVEPLHCTCFHVSKLSVLL
jgi:hypothetical protein